MYAVRIDGRTVDELASLRVAYIRARYDFGARIDDQREYQRAIREGMDVTPGMTLVYPGREGGVISITKIGE